MPDDRYFLIDKTYVGYDEYLGAYAEMVASGIYKQDWAEPKLKLGLLSDKVHLNRYSLLHGITTCELHKLGQDNTSDVSDFRLLHFNFLRTLDAEELKACFKLIFFDEALQKLNSFKKADLANYKLTAIIFVAAICTHYAVKNEPENTLVSLAFLALACYSYVNARKDKKYLVECDRSEFGAIFNDKEMSVQRTRLEKKVDRFMQKQARDPNQRM